jgi:hypothetical protein
MARQPQSTIKNDPLDASDPVSLIIGGGPQRKQPESVKPSTPQEQGRRSHKKEKLTVHLTHDLIERVKNAAYWNPRLTIASIAERGIAAVIEEIERENGGPYPAREEELKGGRPIGSRGANG